jgi:hypothetical protein
VNKIAAAIIACLGAAQYANAENVTLSCLVEETGAKHARRSFEIAFDRQNQLVYIGKTVATAAITESSITFRVDLGTGIPFSFAIDRTTGFISVTGSVSVLYKGQCRVADASLPTRIQNP